MTNFSKEESIHHDAHVEAAFDVQQPSGTWWLAGGMCLCDTPPKSDKLHIPTFRFPKDGRNQAGGS